MIYGLFIGADYEGETCQLPDCAQDAQSMCETLEPFITAGRELLNGKATRRNMLATLAKLKQQMRADDVAIVSWSGHGTTDTIDGKPQQGIVCNDMEIIYEFELRQLLADIGQAVLIADSCFSGGLVRGIRPKHRWIPISHCFHRRSVVVPTKRIAKPHATYLACKSDEVAASTGKGGAFTLALLEAFGKSEGRTTFAGLAKAVKKLLPTKEYPQHPQFACRDTRFANWTLNSFTRKQKWRIA